MKIQVKKVMASLVAACVIAVISPFYLMTSLAAEARISFSDPSVMVGKNVSVSMKINSSGGEALGGSDVTLSYDPNVLEFVSGTNAEGGAGSIRVLGSMDSANTTSFKFTLKFKALQAGKTKITVARQEVNDVNAQPVTVSKQGDSTVNVTPLATYSTDATLKSLKIDPGTLTPQFSTDVMEYTASVGKDVTKLVVSAGTSNANAKVVISGTDLKEEENTVVCKVTAEDGQTVKKYTIKVTKTDVVETTAANEGDGKAVELGDLKATVDGTEYSVAVSFDASLIPDGFQAGKTNYQGKEAASATGNGITLLYLVDADGKGNFYVYKEEDGSLTRFAYVASEGMTIIPVAPDDTVTIPQGLADSSIELDGQSLSGWIWSGEGQDAPYFVFYAMDSKGNKDFYRYDSDQKTIQRYFQDPNADAGFSTEQYVEVANKYNNLITDYNKIRLIAIILGAVLLLAVVIVVVLALTVMKGKTPPSDPDDFDPDRKMKKPKNEKKKKGSALDFLEDDEDDDEYDEYYDEYQDDEYDDDDDFDDEPVPPTRHGNVKTEGMAPRSRKAQGTVGYENSCVGEDDFEEMEDLEDVERSLAARLAREAREAELEVQSQTAGRSAREVTSRRSSASQGTERRLLSDQEPVRPSHNEGTVRRPLPGQEARTPGREPQRRNTRGQETAHRPEYEQEAVRHPIQSQEPARHPVQNPDTMRHMGQESARRPIQGSEAVRRPVQNQEPIRQTARNQEAAKRPVYAQEAVRRPVQNPEPARRPKHPLQEQEPVRHPLKDREPVRRPVHEQEAVRHPLKDREPVRRPVREQEAVRHPLQEPGISRHPEQDKTRRPAQEQNTARRPVQGQSQTGRQAQSQQDFRRPSPSADEAPVRRQPRPSLPEEDDFEFMDLD